MKIGGVRSPVPAMGKGGTPFPRELCPSLRTHAVGGLSRYARVRGIRRRRATRRRSCRAANRATARRAARAIRPIMVTWHIADIVPAANP